LERTSQQHLRTRFFCDPSGVEDGLGAPQCAQGFFLFVFLSASRSAIFTASSSDAFECTLHVQWLPHICLKCCLRPPAGVHIFGSIGASLVPAVFQVAFYFTLAAPSPGRVRTAISFEHYLFWPGLGPDPGGNSILIFVLTFRTAEWCSAS
jgi:hypothetical protein